MPGMSRQKWVRAELSTRHDYSANKPDCFERGDLDSDPLQVFVTAVEYVAGPGLNRMSYH